MDKGHSFSFGTDFHGNLQNIDQFLRVSQERNVDHVIFGGDVTPKKMGISLTDGEGLIMYGGQAETSVPNFNVTHKENLLNTGYMLFDSDINSQQLYSIKSIFDKITVMVGTSQVAQTVSFTPGEIDIFESYMIPKISAHLENTEIGKKIFSMLLEEMRKMQFENNNSIEQFLSELISNFKIRYLLSSGLISNKKFRNLYLCGKEDVSEEEYINVLNNGFRLGCLRLNTFYKFLFSIAPWIEWRQINNNLHQYSLEKQREFLHALFQRIHEFRSRFRGTVSMILGNDDDIELIKDLDEADSSGLIKHVTNRVIPIAPDIQIAGYSFIPPANANYYAWYKDEAEIQTDLKNLAHQIRKDVQFLVTNTHCPPNQTALCQGKDPKTNRTDFGSQAIRDFISQTQPVVALTGHIHESWQVTGKINDKIGRSTVFNPGASEYKPRILIGNLDNPDDFEIVE